ncbi:hypothetical protein BD770DRAFT_410786 [Pilaira anomala]|nr:hypothetical protein BD770DRAFT_410786 [Pilaira anomala]
MSPPFDWLNMKPKTRNQSVSLDDRSSFENNDIWRRGSLPNFKSCVVCNQHAYSTKTCPHSICQDCITSCPLCPTKEPSSPSSICSSTFGNNLYSSNYIDYPEQQDEKFYIGDLLSPSTSLGSFSSCTSPPLEFYCVRLANIPWDVSQKDIQLFFKDFELPSETIQAQSIHIMMDRMTGKTLSDCYIEFPSQSEAIRATEYGNQRTLKNRVLSATLCNHQQFLDITFPRWKKSMHQSNYPTDPADLPWFITRDEINSLLTICKNYKLHFSRKCAERPFENIITIITKYPWDRVSTEQRDSIYNMLRLSIDALKLHLSKQVAHIDPSLLKRMVRCGMMCPRFNELQKQTLLETAGYPLLDIDQLESSYIYIVSSNLNSDTLSLLDILNSPPPPTTTEEKESDEDSYYFCEKDEEVDSFY